MTPLINGVLSSLAKGFASGVAISESSKRDKKMKTRNTKERFLKRIDGFSARICRFARKRKALALHAKSLEKRAKADMQKHFPFKGSRSQAIEGFKVSHKTWKTEVRALPFTVGEKAKVQAESSARLLASARQLANVIANRQLATVSGNGKGKALKGDIRKTRQKPKTYESQSAKNWDYLLEEMRIEAESAICACLASDPQQRSGFVATGKLDRDSIAYVFAQVDRLFKRMSRTKDDCATKYLNDFALTGQDVILNDCESVGINIDDLHTKRENETKRTKLWQSEKRNLRNHWQSALETFWHVALQRGAKRSQLKTDSNNLCELVENPAGFIKRAQGNLRLWPVLRDRINEGLELMQSDYRRAPEKITGKHGGFREEKCTLTV